MNISEPFIERPIATSLLMLGILVFGLASYNLLPVAALPNVDFPTITVTAQLPGASPETMASSVATPLEQQFAAIEGLDQMTSTSGLGATSITLQFELSRNIDGAAQDVQTAINAASGLLPKNLPNPPTYKKVNPADRAILIYAVYSDTMPLYKVDDYAYTILAQRMSTVPGVSQVDIGGEQKYAVRVQVNPDALAGRGIGLEDVRTALAAASIDDPKGNLENAHQSITLDTNDQLFDAASPSTNADRRLSQRRAGAGQGYRQGHRFGRDGPGRRLVRRRHRRAGRAAAGASRRRRQHGRDRQPHQRAAGPACGHRSRRRSRSI